MIVVHALAKLAGLPGTASAHALHVYIPREVEIPMKGVAVPVHGLKGRVTGLASRALTTRTVRGRMDKGAFAVAHHTPLPPMCGLNDPGHGLLIATRTIECARALGGAVRSRDDCTRDHLAVTSPGVTACGHTGPATGHMTAACLVTALPFLLTARSH